MSAISSTYINCQGNHTVQPNMQHKLSGFILTHNSSYIHWLLSNLLQPRMQPATHRLYEEHLTQSTVWNYTGHPITFVWLSSLQLTSLRQGRRLCVSVRNTWCICPVSVLLELDWCEPGLDVRLDCIVIVLITRTAVQWWTSTLSLCVCLATIMADNKLCFFTSRQPLCV